MILHTSSNKDSWFVFIWFCFSWFGVSWVTVKLIYSTQTLGKGLRKEVWIFNKVNSILNGEKKNPVLSPQLVEMNEIEFIFNIDYSIILYQRGLFIKHFFFWLASVFHSLELFCWIEFGWKFKCRSMFSNWLPLHFTSFHLLIKRYWTIRKDIVFVSFRWHRPHYFRMRTIQMDSLRFVL